MCRRCRNTASRTSAANRRMLSRGMNSTSAPGSRALSTRGTIASRPSGSLTGTSSPPSWSKIRWNSFTSNRATAAGIAWLGKSTSTALSHSGPPSRVRSRIGIQPYYITSRWGTNAIAARRVTSCPPKWSRAASSYFLSATAMLSYLPAGSSTQQAHCRPSRQDRLGAEEGVKTLEQQAPRVRDATHCKATPAHPKDCPSNACTSIGVTTAVDVSTPI